MEGGAAGVDEGGMSSPAAWACFVADAADAYQGRIKLTLDAYW